MIDVGQGHQMPESSQSMLNDPVCGVQKGLSTIKADTAHKVHGSNAKEGYHGNGICCSDKKLQVLDIHH